jgi:subtilisin family serine protease
MKFQSSLKVVFVAAAITFGLYGCTDNLSIIDEGNASQSVEQGVSSDSKFRHEKFVRRAMRKRMGKDGEEDYVGLILEIKSGVEQQKVLERLKVLERFKVLERGSYEEVFNGIAIEVVDTFGDQNYTELFMSLIFDPNVIWFEPDLTMELPLSNAVSSPNGQLIPWSVATMGGTESWAQSGNGSGSVDVDVYVLDTGVSNSDINVVETRNFTELSGNDDVDGHGTHIAAIIGAKDDSDGIVGIAPGARIHNFKVLNDDGTAPTSVVISAIEELILIRNRTKAPMVVNMSLGENVGPWFETALDQAVESAVKSGITVVVSAGNWGIDVRNVTPARAEGVITVGAHGMTGKFSSFSNYGSKIDILAPGESIVSLAPGSSSVSEMSGTSMSAAHVTGAVALFLAKNPNASPADAAAWIRGNAIDGVTGVPSETTRRTVWVGSNAAPAQPEVLLVVGTPSNMDAEDVAKKDAFESWGYTVVAIGADESKGTLVTAAADADVIYISEDVNATILGSKLSDVTTGIVSEEGALIDELGMGELGYYKYNRSSMSVQNSSHYITSGFSSSADVSSSQNVIYFTGIGSSVDVLGSWSRNATMLALEKGRTRTDGKSSTGRRVLMPLGPDNFRFTRLKADGLQLWKRSLEWAAGAE